MVMKTESEAMISLKVGILYDDGVTKTRVISEGDYIKVAYNYNGVRRVAMGVVTSIHANPYDAVATKKDWYFYVMDENPDNAAPHLVKIMVTNLLDVEVLHMKNQAATVGTPNDPTRVTTLRIVNGFLQVSQNNGISWRTVDVPLSDRPIPPDDRLYMTLMGMIGSDQYENTDEFVRGVVDLIHQEADRRNHRPWGEYPAPDTAPEDLTGNYSNPPAHSAGMSVGPQHPDFRYD
jgi:hypothetical protein